MRIDVARVEANGVVGAGGAGFPTYVKLKAAGVETVIVNAADCAARARALGKAGVPMDSRMVPSLCVLMATLWALFLIWRPTGASRSASVWGNIALTGLAVFLSGEALWNIAPIPEAYRATILHRTPEPACYLPLLLAISAGLVGFIRDEVRLRALVAFLAGLLLLVGAHLGGGFFPD